MQGTAEIKETGEIVEVTTIHKGYARADEWSEAIPGDVLKIFVEGEWCSCIKRSDNPEEASLEIRPGLPPEPLINGIIDGKPVKLVKINDAYVLWESLQG